MLLAIDTGNTQTVIGLFDGSDLADHWRIATVAERTADELALMIQQFLGFHGFSFDAQITGPMSVGASIQALGGSIHPYSGHVVTGQAHLEYFFVRNFGMGAAYEYTTIELKKTTDTKVIQANYRYDGPRIYAVITF